MCVKHQNDLGESIESIIKIRSDRGKEFENFKLNSFCDNLGIQFDFSIPETLNRIELLRERT